MNARTFVLLSLLFFLTNLGRTLSQQPPLQVWELVDSAAIPEQDFDTAVFNLALRSRKFLDPEYELRYAYYLKFTAEREAFSNRELLFDWPVDTDSSYLRPWFVGRSFGVFTQNSDGTRDTIGWSFAGNTTVEPGRFGIFSVSFSRDGAGELFFSASPISYYGRTFKSGIHARYGFFFQPVHPVYHPSLLSALEPRALLGVHPNPFIEKLTLPWPEDAASAAAASFYGVDGRLAWTKQVSPQGGDHVVLDVGILSPGVYTLVLAPPLGLPYVTQVVCVQ